MALLSQQILLLYIILAVNVGIVFSLRKMYALEAQIAKLEKKILRKKR